MSTGIDSKGKNNKPNQTRGKGRLRRRKRREKQTTRGMGAIGPGIVWQQDRSEGPEWQLSSICETCKRPAKFRGAGKADRQRIRNCNSLHTSEGPRRQVASLLVPGATCNVWIVLTPEMSRSPARHELESEQNKISDACQVMQEEHAALK